MRPDSVEIRCFCSRRPLMAVGGRGTDGKPFVHIRAWKGQRLYVEAVFTSGEVRIRCRECLRWHTVRIVTDKLRWIEEPLGDSIVLPAV